MRYLLVVLTLLISLPVVAYKRTPLLNDGPEISILSGPHKNESTIIVTWPDGLSDKLTYDGREYTETIKKWLDDKAKAYENRRK